jgi:hypothetical protein
MPESVIIKLCTPLRAQRPQMLELVNPGHLHFRRLYSCLVGLALMLPLHSLAQQGYAQGPDGPAPTAGSKPDVSGYSVAGTVVNSATGEPIRRAAVTISGQADRATLTDNSGHFEFDGVAEGRVFVGVTKPGFFNERNANGLTTLQVAPDASPVLLRMVPGGAIVGRVTTRDEQPLEGFQVGVITRQNLGGRQAWFGSPFFQARTDERGDFRLANLPAATYYVEVDQSLETTLVQPGIPNAREQVYAKVFYPGVAGFGAAAPLELRAGQQLEANFTLTAEPIYQISGVVSTPENLSSPLTFTRKSAENYDFTQSVPTQDGKFQSKLPAGAYSVSGSTANGVLLSTLGASVEIGSDSPDVHVGLAPAAFIEVAIRTDPVGGASQPDLSKGQFIPGMTLQLVSTTPLLRSNNWWRAPSGGIQNVEPGVYTLEINTAGPWWVKSARSGAVDLLSDDLTVTAGIQPPPIEVTLLDDAATVIGTVAQADQPELVTVLLVQPRSHRNLIKAVPAGQGRFQFQGVPPGDYSLLAFDHADQLEYADPEVLNPYLSGAVHISLQPHGTASVNLNLSPISR